MINLDFTTISTFKELEDILKSNPVYNLGEIKEAFDFAAKVHANKKRLSGHDYICHPLTVAKYIAMLNLDQISIISSLVHDVPQQSEITIDELDSKFGTDVAFIVDGLSTMRKFSQQTSKAESEVADLKTLIFNATEDIRVVLIRIAEKIHNIQDYQVLPENLKVESANKALKIYAPLAEYLGLGIFQRELEDKAFKILDSKNYEFISSKIESFLSEKQDVTASFGNEIVALLQKYKVANSEFQIRRKGVYSAYKKLKRKYLKPGESEITSDSFDKLMDIFASRIFVDTVEDCYVVLSIIQSNFETLQDEFVDYIASPKENGYKSIHLIIKYKAITLEVQIKTKEMHEFNEFGPASHIAYKLGKSKGDSSTTWTKDLVKWQDSAEIKKEDFKIKAFAESIFVFTPKFLVIRLDKGSTPIDFAFRIHTDLGYKYSGAKVNGKMVSMDYKLQTGDIIDILTMSKENVTMDWLKFAKMTETKSRIRRRTSNKTI